VSYVLHSWWVRMQKNILHLIDEAKKVRRQLHTIPEEGYEEFKTSEFIYNYLTCLGVKQIERVATTGIVALLPGECTENAIAIRGDMDGLSVEEENNCEFKSVHKGMMHACGHDGHMTILLLFAKYVIENNIRPKNNILLIFQPAEEGPGGAKNIIDQGILKKYKVKKIYMGVILCPQLKKVRLDVNLER